MSYENVTVFGGGNAAFAVAACMSLKGRRVTLCDFPEFESSIAPVKQAGEIELLRQDGPLEGRAKIHRVTTNIAEAVRDADLILACCQAYAHGLLARQAAPHLRDGQHVLLLPGSCFGAWEFRMNLKQADCKAKVVVAESNTLVFATRKTNAPNQARIKHWATEVFIAALPAGDTAKILKPFAELFSQCVAANDTLETCLLNLNPYVHSAPAVLSISAVERSGGEFYHYVDGITPSTAKAMIALDNERVAACKAFGYRDWSVAEIFHRAGYLGQRTGDWVADMQSKAVLREAKGPFNIKYRYYTEDTGVGLTVVHSIGRRLALPMPTHHALIHLCGVMNETDYFAACTRTLDRLEIAGADPASLRALFA
ncbi:MAG: NAD/NADP octopine/nopaline dehydrogenase family protein [Verrucomicrobia bacterium]|nr:NAD/NADP octopine/nopaline dehydrogenase family protein [Verrucomicrobiota bacterium]